MEPNTATSSAHPKRARRAGRLAAVAAALAALTGATYLASGPAAAAPTAPAASPPSLRKVTSNGTGFQSDSTRTETAVCGANERVVGGGALINDLDANQVRLSGIYPDRSGVFFRAVADEPAAGFSGQWDFEAYALCAPLSGLPGYQVVTSPAAFTTGTFQSRSRACEGGRKVIGTGAAVANGGRHVGLQLNRASGPLDISRATARVDTDEYDRSWTVISYAICIFPISGQNADGDVRPGPSGDGCCNNQTGTYVHGPGGGGGLTDGGPVFLQTVYPYGSLRSVMVVMTGKLYPHIGGMVASAVCAR
jgi:hypothetical protein